MESLNIKHGKYCWKILIDLILVNFDGNYFDAMNFAVLSLFLKYRHQVAMEDGADLKVYEENERAKRIFTLNQIPCLFTFSILNPQFLDPKSEGDLFILDPTVSQLAQ